MDKIQDFLVKIIEDEEIKGIATLTSIDGKMEFSSAGTFREPEEAITVSTSIPLNHIFDIFISSFFTYTADDYKIDLRKPVVKLLDKLIIKEEINSMVYLQSISFRIQVVLRGYGTMVISSEKIEINLFILRKIYNHYNNISVFHYLSWKNQAMFLHIIL